MPRFIYYPCDIAISNFITLPPQRCYNSMPIERLVNDFQYYENVELDKFTSSTQRHNCSSFYLNHMHFTYLHNSTP